MSVATTKSTAQGTSSRLRKKILKSPEVTKVYLTENGFTPEQEAEINRATEEALQGINLSPAFTDVDELFEYLMADHSDDD